MTDQYPAEAVDEIRKWVRHQLLRQYGEDGHVLPENIKLSERLAALLSYVEGVKWQPIESAPDNEDVLLVVPRYGSSKFPIYEMAVGRMGRDGGWYSDSDETDEYRLHEPKYWRPLPPAPDSEG